MDAEVLGRSDLFFLQMKSVKRTTTRTVNNVTIKSPLISCIPRQKMGILPVAKPAGAGGDGRRRRIKVKKTCFSFTFFASFPTYLTVVTRLTQPKSTTKYESVGNKNIFCTKIVTCGFPSKREKTTFRDLRWRNVRHIFLLPKA